MVGCDTGALEPGRKLRLTIVAVADESVPEGTNVVNLAEVTGEEPVPDTGNNVAQASTTVGPPGDETIRRFERVGSASRTKGEHESVGETRVVRTADPTTLSGETLGRKWNE